MIIAKILIHDNISYHKYLPMDTIEFREAKLFQTLLDRELKLYFPTYHDHLLQSHTQDLPK